MLNWVNRFNIFCFLDNQEYSFNDSAFECLVAAGCKEGITVKAGNAFEKVKEFSNNKKQWLFGHFGYDLKNETETLNSNNYDGVNFTDMHFFVPQIVLQLTKTQLDIYCDDDNAAEIFHAIQSSSNTIKRSATPKIDIKTRFSKEEYLESIYHLKQHIARGDCYEINFCQEFYAENATIHPLETYAKLTAISPTPFSAFYKVNDKYCLCASPERYIKKTGSKIISQPIKGTAKRNLVSKTADENNKANLLNSQKERSENVMVVDLVRNDLSKICTKGSVKVDELFGIYSFPQVHQMISTVSGIVNEDVHWVDIIKATFPMGSMTGAPKKRVMQLIEQYEKTKRGLFSGAIGYVAPNGNFDFNVVIRSIFYNATAKYVSFKTGGAITFYSNAQKEYEESLLKAEAMIEVLA